MLKNFKVKSGKKNIKLCTFNVKLNLTIKNQEKVDETKLLKPLENGECPFYPNTTREMDLFGSSVEWILTIGILICLALYYFEFQVNSCLLALMF